MDISTYFAREPRAVPAYRAAEQAIGEAFPGVHVDVQRSQITFRLRGEIRVEDPRIVEAVQPYPGRWTLHTLIASVEDVDEQLIEWLREAAEPVAQQCARKHIGNTEGWTGDLIVCDGWSETDRPWRG